MSVTDLNFSYIAFDIVVSCPHYLQSLAGPAVSHRSVPGNHPYQMVMGQHDPGALNLWTTIKAASFNVKSPRPEKYF